MSRSRFICCMTLAAVLVFSGCAKKTQPVAEPPPPEPVAVEKPATPEPPPVEVAEPEPADPLVEAGLFTLQGSELGVVYFDFDSSALTSPAQDTLRAAAEQLKADQKAEFTVAGHCDARGSDEYNLSLGERRSHAVRDFLISLGIGAERLAVISYGEERPAVAGSGEAVWAKNRRVEFE